MVKLEIRMLNSGKVFQIIIDLNKSINFDYLLEYLSYGYPQENFCPCFQFIDCKKTRYIKQNEKVIDLSEKNSNTFYITNPNIDKKCHCNEFVRIHYRKSKLEIMELLNEMMSNYNAILDGMGDEIKKLVEDKKKLEMSINNPELIDKLKTMEIIGENLKPRENLTKINPDNNQIIVNENVTKKNFVDFYDVIIDIKSIKDICNGWEIKMSDKGKQNYEQYNKTKNLKIGVIGNSNKGKSFLLSRLSKTYLPSGTSIRTEGLSIKYPDLELFKDRKIILLDSAGLETPVLRKSKSFDNINKEEQEFNLIKNGEDKNMNEKDYLKDEFKEKSREKIITELFLQDYIIDSSDILILVVGILTYSEQKLINKIKKLQKEKKKKTHKPLFIIHNLITYTSIEQVNDYIKENLFKSATFILEEGHNISTKTEVKKGKYYYEKNEDFKIFHLIYANEGSEAGNYYNKTTLDFLENSFQDITNLETFDVIKTVKKRFIDLSNEFFENFDKITINDFNNDSKSIKLMNHNNLTLKKCFIDELGFSNLKSNEFEPKYNYYKKDNKIIVKIESPGNNGPLSYSIYNREGTKIIKIKGEKKNEKEPEDVNDNIFISREFGKFSIQCLLNNDDTYLLKNQEPKIYEKKGIIFLEYQLEEKLEEKEFIINSEEI